MSFGRTLPDPLMMPHITGFVTPSRWSASGGWPPASLAEGAATPMPRDARPDWDTYFMTLARHVAQRSNCCRRQVGAVIVREKALVSTGYNGTPFGVKNCFEGGCARCNSDAPPGQSYDTCICVHAEENAIALAARHGAVTDGGTLFSTLRPCFGCAKEMVQAGIREAVFEIDMGYPPALEIVYKDLIAQSGLVLRQFRVPK